MFTSTSDIVVQEAKQGTKLQLKRVNVDVLGKRLTITYNVGTVSGEDFTVLGEKSAVIANTPDTEAVANETLQFATGEMTLTNTPVANLRLYKGATTYSEGVDYSVSGTTVTSITIADGVDISAAYTYTVPGATDYDDVIGSLLSDEEDIWTTLTTYGILTGSMDV